MRVVSAMFLIFFILSGGALAKGGKNGLLVGSETLTMDDPKVNGTSYDLDNLTFIKVGWFHLGEVGQSSWRSMWISGDIVAGGDLAMDATWFPRLNVLCSNCYVGATLGFSSFSLLRDGEKIKAVNEYGGSETVSGRGFTYGVGAMYSADRLFAIGAVRKMSCKSDTEPEIQCNNTRGMVSAGVWF